jgi:hydrogenase nickel incorporation protein HypA/HybF
LRGPTPLSGSASPIFEIMHELSVAESILDILTENARLSGYRRVKLVRLEIGALACIEPEALRFCFDAVMKDSLAEGATLEIAKTMGQGWCAPCCRSVPIEALYDPCPLCGNAKVNVTAGTAMRVKELEVE